MLIYQMVYGGFRKWGYPYIIHFNGIFHNKPSSSWGIIICGTPLIQRACKMIHIVRNVGSLPPGNQVHQQPLGYQLWQVFLCSGR